MNPFKRNKNKHASEPLVSVLDVQSQTVSRIPARELAPGMVEVRVEGIEGTVWIEAANVQQGEMKHPPFDEDTRLLLQEIQEAVSEFYSLSLEKWEDGFRRDINPEREIALWLHMARTFKKALSLRQWSEFERKEIFQVLISCMNSPREHILKTCALNVLSTEDAERVIDLFFNAD